MNHGWQSEATDGSKGGWCLLSFSLFLSLSVSFSDYLPTYPPIYLSIHLAVYLSIYPSSCLSIHLSIYPSIHLPIYLSICLSVCLSIYLSICKLENEAILQDFRNVWTWQRQKRSNSARLRQLLNLITSQAKQCCETSSFFKVDNVKNEAILRDFVIFQSWQHQKQSNSARLPQFSKLTTSKTEEFCETSFKSGKLSAELTASYQCVLRFFRSICLNYCACHEKVMPGHTKLHL